jgi:uncharacterized membrane protein
VSPRTTGQPGRAGHATHPEQRRTARVDATLVVALVGLALSAYLTLEHYTSPAVLACPEGVTINCAKVTSSPWSEILGIPVAVLGLVYFVGMTCLLTPAAWRRPRLDPLRVAGAGLGVLMALYLVWVELFRVDALCLWCTGVHLTTLVLLGTVLWRTTGVRQA